MAVEIPFRREFSFEYGRLEPVAPMIRRIVARNPSAFTFRGTGTYVVGAWLDKRFGWNGKGVLIGVLVGLAAGMYLMIKDAIRANKD